MTERTKQPDGMRAFFIIWIGQLISTLGSGLTSFAMGVWIYEHTSSVVLFAVNAFVYMGMSMLVSPFAGAVVDRINRRLILILSDTGAALSSLVIWLLLRSGHLQIWHILVAAAFNAAFTAFQYPAHTAATTMLVPRQHLGRAGGMVQIGEAISGLAAPAAAGALYVTYGLNLIILIDFLTFLAAVTTLLVVFIPEPARQPVKKDGKPTIWQEINIGWRFIADRQGLLYWMVYLAAINFSFGMISPLMTPMMLELGNPQQVGLSEAAFGLGMLAGTFIMSLWGGPKRRFYAVLGSAIWTGLCMIV
ncbi:MAG TPA: MFS transporter, partial [Anaerolineales bacterium]|nr:MFS transporter [Anaerolineales bacterium]